MQKELLIYQYRNLDFVKEDKEEKKVYIGIVEGGIVAEYEFGYEDLNNIIFDDGKFGFVRLSEYLSLARKTAKT